MKVQTFILVLIITFLSGNYSFAHSEKIHSLFSLEEMNHLLLNSNDALNVNLNNEDEQALDFSTRRIKSPSVLTNAISDLTATSVVLNGEIHSFLHLNLIESGFVYAKTSDDATPSLAEVNGTTVIKQVIDGNSGTLIHKLTDLQQNTEYSYRAYAIIEGFSNLEGAVLTFRTVCPNPTGNVSNALFVRTSNTSVTLSSFSYSNNSADGYYIFFKNENDFAQPDSANPPSNVNTVFPGLSQQLVYVGNSTSPNVTVTNLREDNIDYYFYIVPYSMCNDGRLSYQEGYTVRAKRSIPPSNSAIKTQFDFEHNIIKTNSSVVQSMNGITATVTNAESSTINFSEITGKGESRVVSSNSATSKLTIMFSDSLAVYSLNVFAATMTGNTDVTLTPIVRTGSTLHLSDPITETVDLSVGKTFEVHFADIVGLEITATTAIDFGIDNIEFSRIEIEDIEILVQPSLAVNNITTSMVGERSYLIDKASCKFTQLDHLTYLQIASNLNPFSTYTLSNILQCDLSQGVGAPDFITTLNSYPKVKNINIQKQGDVLTATYEYEDGNGHTETGTTFQWYRSSSSTGLELEEIQGATSASYTITSNDTNKYLFLKITPRDELMTASDISGPFMSLAVSNLQLPMVTTNSASTVNATSAILGGDVTSNSGASVTERGFVYAKTSDDATPSLAEVNGTTVFKQIVTGTTGVFNHTLTALQHSTEYSYIAYATNENGSGEGEVETFTTLCGAPSGQVSNESLGTATATSLTLSSFTAPADGADGYYIGFKHDNSFDHPVQGVSYASIVNTDFGGQFQQPVYTGNSSSPNVTVTGLDERTTYYFYVVPYTICNGAITYKDTGYIVRATTACGAPSGQVSNESLGTATTSSLTLSSFTAPADGADGYYIGFKHDNNFDHPVNGVSYTGIVNTVFGGQFQQPVYTGDSSNPNITVTNLNQRTTYYFYIVPYNICNGTITYKETGYIVSATTACAAPSGQVSNESLGTATTTSVNLSSFTAPTDGADGYYIGFKHDNNFDHPVQGVSYTGIVNTVFGGQFQQPVYIGNSSSPNVTVTNLNPETDYYFYIVPYNICDGTITYKDAGYIINTSTNSLTTPTLTFDNITKTYGDAGFKLAATSNSSGTISYEIVGEANGTTLSGTNNEDVSLGKVGDVTIRATVAADGIYESKSKEITLSITQKSITVVADAKSKTYGDSDPSLTYQVTGLVGSDVLSGNLTREAGEAIGTYAINQGTLDNSNYSISYTSEDLTITKKSITVVADAKSKTYGDSDPSLTYQVTGLVGSDVLSGNLTREPGEAIGTYAINQGTLDNSNYSISYTSDNLTINKKSITVVADAKSKTYGDSDPALTYQVTGLVGSDVLSGNLTREPGEAIGTYAINQGTLDNSNYSISYTSADLTITQKSITVVADAKSKAYGDSDPALTYQVTGLVGSDVLSGNLTREPGEAIGTYAINQGTLDNSNYSISYTSEDLTITKKSITVVADAKSKTYGDSDPSLTYQVTGLVGSDVLNGSLTRESGEVVGIYAITQGTLDNSNYSISYTSADLTINKKSITVLADAKSKAYGDSDPSLTYQVTGLVGSDVLNGSLSRESGEVVGTYAITQGTLDNSNYSISYTSDDLTITKRGLTITADSDQRKLLGEDDPVFTYSITTGNLVNNDQFTGVLTRESGENIGTYAILQGSLNAGDNYDLSFVSADFTIAMVVTSGDVTVASTGAQVSANIAGVTGVVEKGVVYSFVDTTPEIGESDVFKVIDTSPGTTITVDLTSLAPNQLYFYQAYVIATNNSGKNETTYGGVQSFTTVSSEPSATIYSPVDNATGIARDMNLSITFDQTIQKGTGNIVIRKSTDNSIVETIDVSSAQVIINSQEITINPTNALPENTEVYVTIGVGAIQNTSNDNWAGLADNASWSFTTNTTLSTGDILTDNAIGVYPNPTKGQVQIRTSNGLQIEKISIYNITGKHIKDVILTDNKMDISRVADGVYFLRIATDKGIVTKRIVKY